MNITEAREFSKAFVELIQESALERDLPDERRSMVKRSLFPGEWYYDKTKLPRQKQSGIYGLFGLDMNPLIGDTRVDRLGREIAPPLFMFGYKMKFGNIFYELWFDPYNSTFMVVDNVPTIKRKSTSIKPAIESLLDLIARSEDLDDDQRREITQYERDLYSAINKQSSKLSNLERKKKSKGFMRRLIGNILKSTDLEVATDSVEFDIDKNFMITENEQMRIRNELNSVASIEDIISEFISVDIYHESKIKPQSGAITKVVDKLLGRGRDVEIETPLSVLKKSMKKLQTNRGDLYFIRGFSIMDGKINLEIWQLVVGDRSEYFLFNITSNKLIMSSTNLRRVFMGAVNYIGKVII